MCGRYDINVTAQVLAERFGVDILAKASGGVSANSGASLGPRYNVAPGQRNPVVMTDGSGQNQLALMQWGLVPAWSREAKVSYSTINARAETIATKPAFRKPLASQRCLVPATGYFEWAAAPQGAQGDTPDHGSQGKQPYRIKLRGEGLDEVFAFAGLYDIWRGPDGEELQTYAIVTTRANDAFSYIHSRMPVILPDQLTDAWLDPNNKDLDKLVSLLQPYPEDKMTAYPVSRLVNNVANDGRELILPLH